MKVKRLLSILLSALIILSGISVFAVGESNIIGWEVYLDGVALEEPVGFVGENLRAKIYGQNIQDFTGLDMTPSWNSEVASLISAKDNSKVTNGYYSQTYAEPLKSECTSGNFTGSDGNIGIWVEDGFLSTWSIDWEGYPAADIVGLKGQGIFVEDDYVYIAVISDPNTGEPDTLSIEGKINLFDLNLLAENPGELNLGFKKDKIQAAKDGFTFAFEKSKINVTEVPYSFEILEKPEEVTDVTFDDTSYVVSWNETINRGAEVKLYCNDVEVTSETVVVDYGTKNVDFSSYFNATPNPGTYKVGIKALGADFDAEEVFADETVVVVIPLEAPGNVEWNGKTVVWDAVENASSYKVVIYENDIPVKEIKDITATEINLKDYLLNGTYKTEVLAIGDGSVYGDSEKATSSDIIIQEVVGYAKLLYPDATDFSDITITYDGETTKTDASGKFTLKGLVEGENTLNISYPGALTRTIKVNVSAAGTRNINGTADAIGLIQGDVDGDGIIGMVDITSIISEFGKDITDDNRLYDFDKNNAIFTKELSWTISKNGLQVVEPSETETYAYEDLVF